MNDRPKAKHAYAFLFNDGEVAVECDTLKQALEQRPHLTSDNLVEVWCLNTCNLIWSDIGYCYSGPWEDE